MIALLMLRNSLEDGKWAAHESAAQILNGKN